MITRDYYQAEDLTHETFINAFNRYDSFQQKAKPRTWLFSIAHIVTVDFLRKKKTVDLVKELLQGKSETSLLTEDIIINKEISEDIYLAIGCLKASYREVIILREIKEFSLSETSEILNWSESKVKTTLHRVTK